MYIVCRSRKNVSQAKSFLIDRLMKSWSDVIRRKHQSPPIIPCLLMCLVWRLQHHLLTHFGTFFFLCYTASHILKYIWLKLEIIIKWFFSVAFSKWGFNYNLSVFKIWRDLNIKSSSLKLLIYFTRSTHLQGSILFTNCCSWIHIFSKSFFWFKGKHITGLPRS